MTEHKQRIPIRTCLRYSLLAIPVVAVALVTALSNTQPVQAATPSMTMLPDSASVSGDDIEGGDDYDQDIFSSISTPEVKNIADTTTAFTLQGTKARTLRSRTVYIVNGKKRYKN